MLCLCWECRAAREGTRQCPLHEPLLSWGQTPAFPALALPWHGQAVVPGCHVQGSLCQGSGACGAGAIPGSQLMFGPSGLLLLAGSCFWRAVILARAVSSLRGCGQNSCLGGCLAQLGGCDVHQTPAHSQLGGSGQKHSKHGRNV